VLAIQPGRYRYVHPAGRLPEYGVLVTGARQVLSDGVRPRAIRTAFRAETPDPGFPYRILGGRLDPASNVDVEILPNGGVRYRTDPR
jgi:hypothetical protein